ncbi:MAG: PIN domain-containing protein [Pirellulales bacterium]
MLLYLDANCFNRPFDDQHQDRIRQEAAAVLEILQRILDGKDELAWSSALTLELTAHPEPDIRAQLTSWARHSRDILTSHAPLRRRVEAFVGLGLKALDAAHVAFAEAAGCTAFLTCDDRLARQASRLGLSLRVLNPVEYLSEARHAGTAD